jgi:hypothetical protein
MSKLCILEKEKLYLSKKKLFFLAAELNVLGHKIDNSGIRMDPDKVDSISKWKVPMNWDLLRGFLRSVGYLSDDVLNIRIPMYVLLAITGDTIPFQWGFTEQQAFEDVKALVHAARSRSRVPVSYAEDALPVWVITNGCNSGISGIISQGADWQTAKVATFYSAKLNSAQQNYLVHKIEMLAGVETMLRHKDVLLGVYLEWLTDHKGLVYLLNQKNLSGRQARWLEKIAIFNYKIKYVTGLENILADVLSWIYAIDSATDVRSRSEYTYFDVIDDDSDAFGGHPAVMAISTRGAAALLVETGCPETSQEFAARMRGRFQLWGPGPRREGKNGTTPSIMKQLPGVAKQLSSEGINLINKFWGNYSQDPIFEAIIRKPKNFWNFLVDNEIIYPI